MKRAKENRYVGLWVTADASFVISFWTLVAMTKPVVKTAAPIRAATCCRVTTSSIGTTPVSPLTGIFVTMRSITPA